MWKCFFATNLWVDGKKFGLTEVVCPINGSVDISNNSIVMIFILQWTRDVEFLVDNLWRHTRWLIKDKHLKEEQLVLF